ncbi:unnamed protein product [Brassica oleracea var. botrytis]
MSLRTITTSRIIPSPSTQSEKMSSLALSHMYGNLSFKVLQIFVFPLTCINQATRCDMEAYSNF